MIHETKLPNGIWLDARTNKPLKSTTKYICSETGSILYEKQIG